MTDEIGIDTGATLTATDQPPLSAVDVAADQPPSQFWTALFDDDRVRDTFARAARAFASGRTVPELFDALEERDVPYWLWSWIRDVARGDKAAALHLIGRLLPGLGHGHSSLDDISPVINLLEAVEDPVPTIAVRVDDSFRDRPRQQRKAVLELVVHLAQHFNVRLVAPQVTGRWVCQTHRETLPRVSEWSITPPDAPPTEAAVAEACDALDPDGRPVAILRRLAACPSGSQTFGEAYAAATVDESRVRQCFNRLAAVGLVERFGPDQDRRVEILEAGDEFLEVLDADIGRQQSLEESVSDPPKSHPQAVLSRASTGGGDGRGLPYRTAWCGRAEQCLVGGAASAGEVQLVKTVTAADADGEARRERRISYDANRDEVLVSVGVAGGLQYIVSLAVALASAPLLERALPDDRLEAIDEDHEWLRGARNIGYLSDEALADPDRLREDLVDAGREIAEMTRDHHCEEYDDRDRHRADIMQDAHGLAGSLVHLFDTVGCSVHRRIRLAEGLEDRKLQAIAKTVGISSAIQSRYGSFAVYRQLFETDAGEPHLSPTVDAVDPVGHVIGGTVITGPDVDRLRDPLTSWLRQPGELVEDPEAFVVRMAVKRAGRDVYRGVLGRGLQHKHLHPTEAATDLLYGFCPSPKAIAEAVMRQLQRGEPRDLRPDEVRQILRGVDAEALVPELPRTVGAVLAALLELDGQIGRISQRELADRAGVSTQSVRNNREFLQALDIVDVDADGWRLAVAYNSRKERRDPRLPASVRAALPETLDLIVATALPPGRYGDPDDPVGSVLHWPPDPWRLLEADHELGPWLALAARLAGVARPEESSTVEMGPTIVQEPIADDGRAAA
jgi:hypothetical protein